MPEVGVTEHEGTYLMWLDFSCLGLGEDLCKTLVDECGIGAGDGIHYGESGRNFIRLNIGCAKCLLEVAMDAMKGLYTKRMAEKSAVQAEV